MQILPTVRLTLLFITDVDCWNGLIYFYFCPKIDFFSLICSALLKYMKEQLKPALHKAADEMKK